MIKLYGIPNCDTIKKARQWLEKQGIPYEFHDYKKAGVNEKQLRRWVETLGWESLLNRRGMTWRKLDDAVKANIDQASAIQVMLRTPSIIKRPVLEKGKSLHVGFKTDEYSRIFS
ncbi:MAG: ArsC family reductase [Candidatus Thiodiazotropha sp. (ex Dulcina madagascariensis)]|nr:ArsC family reductase [Candidatus Thiodiazotropha sp. (ex Epidulcina cf. delphinae)]MCU7923510.1 ArsC family reductase [Candidatus Thiodiazotropha sp. (ex Dulcina madagascariensis)]MCU7926575.1 ArsC family reductase [Candidatus Thiodiazotropha sp. (ex Dulcina madagascariensis)]